MAAIGLPHGCGSASAATFCKAGGNRNCFTGKFGLVDIPGDADRKLLEADFGSIDVQGTGRQTNKATKSDGASISEKTTGYRVVGSNPYKGASGPAR